MNGITSQVAPSENTLTAKSKGDIIDIDWTLYVDRIPVILGVRSNGATMVTETLLIDIKHPELEKWANEKLLLEGWTDETEPDDGKKIEIDYLTWLEEVCTRSDVKQYLMDSGLTDGYNWLV